PRWRDSQHYIAVTHSSVLLPPPPTSSLFPYTTLFRSPRPLTSKPRSDGYPAPRSQKAQRSAAKCHPPRSSDRRMTFCCGALSLLDRKSTRLNSSHSQISYAVFCLKKKKQNVKRPSLYK